MKNQLSAEEIRNILEITRRAAEDKRRKETNIAALEAAKKQIKERGQFLPKDTRPTQVLTISF